MTADFYPPLTPAAAQWMRQITGNQKLLSDLVEKYGSPLNLHHPETFIKNYRAYQSVLEKYGLSYTIYFARKANKCCSYVRAAAQAGFGVDTASYRELKQCLELGCDPARLVVTAAVKDESLVRLALNHNVQMILDNEDECRLVNRCARELDKQPEVGLRISGFTVGEQKLYSRFGVDFDNVVPFVMRLCWEQSFDRLHFGGFHFHLDGYSIAQRGAALLQTIQLTDALRERDISTSFIDAGGGFLVQYLRDTTEWHMFWDELKKAVRGERAPVTFNNDGLGLAWNDGNMQGSPAVYPFYNETPKEQFLDAILSCQNSEGQTVAALLKDRHIRFRMEPGRSLLDQAGMTVARVAHRKKDQRGDWLVGLQMNGSQMNSSSADFLVDPIFIPVGSSSQSSPVAVYFTGAFCLENDLIIKRKIVLPQLPEPGNLVAFPNTAGYLMHFYETKAHRFNLATNLIAEETAPNHFVRDEEYAGFSELSK